MGEMTPRTKAKADQIRRAARKLFLAHGAGATSMDAITAEAGVSKQTVYAYFPSKEHLLFDVISGLVEQHAQDWQQAQPVSRPLDSWEDLESELAALSNRVLDLMEPEFLETLRLLATESGSSATYGEVFRERLADPILGSFRDVLRRADGLLAEPVHDDIPRLLVGSLLSFVVVDGLFRAEDIKRPSPRRVRRLVAYFVGGLRATAESPVPA